MKTYIAAISLMLTLPGPAFAENYFDQSNTFVCTGLDPDMAKDPAIKFDPPLISLFVTTQVYFNDLVAAGVFSGLPFTADSVVATGSSISIHYTRSDGTWSGQLSITATGEGQGFAELQERGGVSGLQSARHKFNCKVVDIQVLRPEPPPRETYR